MGTTRRAAAIAAAGVALAALLSGCGGDSASPAPGLNSAPTATSASAPTATSAASPSASSGSGAASSAAGGPTVDIPLCSALSLATPSKITGMTLVLGENYNDAALGSSCTFNGNGKGGTQDHPSLRLEVTYIPVPASEHADHLKAVQSTSIQAATSVITDGSLKSGEAASFSLSDSVDELVGANATPGSGQIQMSKGYTLQLAQLDGDLMTVVVAVNKTTKDLPWQDKATAARSAQALLNWATKY